jgi:cytochrome c peroxidase
LLRNQNVTGRSLIMKKPWAMGVVLAASVAVASAQIGREVSIPRHLEDGEEFLLQLKHLLRFGRDLFVANWTAQEGGGRPLAKGNGNPLADLGRPLEFPFNMNRVSAPDANSCAGCHNAPFGIPGGGGDFVTGVFVLGQRFDFVTFDHTDAMPTRGSTDEQGNYSTLGDVGNYRATLGMFGAGFIEMLARQMTGELQAIRNGMPNGTVAALVSKGVSFGFLERLQDGTWDTSRVEGLPATSLKTTGPGDPPSLVIRPFHQAGAVVSLREFTNNAFNHHHGIQSTERFGVGTDPDGDGFVDEMTRADVTAATLFQATLKVPGRVIPDDPEVESAVVRGEQKFVEIGCAGCHVPSLPLTDQAWIFTEPNPFNPPGNLRVGEAPTYAVDLTRVAHDGVTATVAPTLKPDASGVVHVPAFTDLKLHDITSGPEDPNREALDMHQPAGSPAFFAGNRKFLTRKLWGVANEPPFFHHGKFTTLREAILAHAGEALSSRQGFEALPASDRDAIVEMLKTLQVLPPGTRALVVNEKGQPKAWPPAARRPKTTKGRERNVGHLT